MSQHIQRTPLEPLMLPAEAREILRVSRRRMYDLLRQGEIPAVRIGSRVYVRPNDLRSYIDRMTTQRAGQ